MSRKRGARLSIKDAINLVPENMGDAAQVALAAEMSGVEIEDVFLSLADDARRCAPPSPRPHLIARADDARRHLRKRGADVAEFVETHWRVNGVVDFWPTTGRWKYLDGSASGRGVESLIKALGLKARKAQP